MGDVLIDPLASKSWRAWPPFCPGCIFEMFRLHRDSPMSDCVSDSVLVCSLREDCSAYVTSAQYTVCQVRSSECVCYNSIHFGAEQPSSRMLSAHLVCMISCEGGSVMPTSAVGVISHGDVKPSRRFDMVQGLLRIPGSAMMTNERGFVHV